MSLQTYPTEDKIYVEEDLPYSQPQVNLNDYLKSVLKYLYAVEGWIIASNLAIYPPKKGGSYPFKNLAPDVALFKSVVISQPEQANLSSWMMNMTNRPAPTVVFEVSSEATWPVDLDSKPDWYGLLGSKEYFAYDPQRLWKGAQTQLRGWRYNNKLKQEINPDSQGRLWSAELNSWLAAEGAYLRLYDPQGNLRFTAEEAVIRQAEIAARQAEIAAQQAEADRAALQQLLEKLRQHNIDPEKL